jgi:hypothetical protein
MSKIAISGAATGTATFTIESPATSTNRTLTLPDNTGTIITTGSTFAGTGPAFSAYLSANQTGIANATYTKVQINTEEFDTASCFDNSTNYRFTPNVAGYYQVNGELALDGGWTSCLITIYKNGLRFKDGVVPNNVSLFGTNVSSLVYLDGSTDYIELYVWQNTGGPKTLAGGNQYNSYFQASMVRAA